MKINVHAFTLNEALSNKNNSGMEIVLRDHEGRVIKMVSGTTCNLTERANELWELLAGLRSAFCKKEYNIQMEIYNLDVVREWED